MAFFHHPRFVDPTPSGGGQFWRALEDFGAEAVVNGHEHYFAMSDSINADGNPAPATGIRQFIVGTGGRSFQQPPTPMRPAIAVVDASEFGVMVISLSATGYLWQFRRTGDGQVLYSGTGGCS